MSELGKERNPVTAADLRNMFARHQASYSPSTVDAALENATLEANDARMGDMDREEVKARLEASEARVATVVESMRADAAELRSQLHTGLEQIKSQGAVAQASADKFYAQSESLLAESKTLLAEIRMAGEKNRADVMGMGYKVITWTLATILTVGSLSVGAYNALKPKQQQPISPPPVQIVPQELIIRQQQPEPAREPAPPAKP